MRLGTRRLVGGGSTTHLFPWAGDRATNTIAVHLQALGLDAEALAAAILNKGSEEFDGLLDESLLCAEYARRALDVEGEWRAIESIVRSGEGDR